MVGAGFYHLLITENFIIIGVSFCLAFVQFFCILALLWLKCQIADDKKNYQRINPVYKNYELKKEEKKCGN